MGVREGEAQGKGRVGEGAAQGETYSMVASPRRMVATPPATITCLSNTDSRMGSERGLVCLDVRPRSTTSRIFGRVKYAPRDSGTFSSNTGLPNCGGGGGI